jgi:hypothetical protein
VPGDPDHALFSGLDFSGVWMTASNRPTARIGSTVLAQMSPTCSWNVGQPSMVYWDLGSGRSLAYIHRWHSELGNFFLWKYHQDFLCNLIYFTAQIDIPQDLELVHATRARLAEIETEWLCLLSTMDVAYKFGANLAPIDRQLAEVNRARQEADRLYIYQDFESCMSCLDATESDLEVLVERTMAIKDAVMVWIFAIQWLSVSGTSMVAGYVLWVLMVRRRILTEVKTTRLISHDGV